MLGAVVVFSTATGGRFALAATIAGVAALVVLALGIALRLQPTVPWAVALTGAGYLATRVGHETVDGYAALVGAGLLASAELAFRAIVHDPRIRTERAVVVRRVATSAGLVAGALLLDFLLLGAAAFSTPSSIVLAAMGVAAAVTAVAVVLRLLRPRPAGR